MSGASLEEPPRARLTRRLPCPAMRPRLARSPVDKMCRCKHRRQTVAVTRLCTADRPRTSSHARIPRWGANAHATSPDEHGMTHCGSTLGTCAGTPGGLQLAIGDQGGTGTRGVESSGL